MIDHDKEGVHTARFNQFLENANLMKDVVIDEDFYGPLTVFLSDNGRLITLIKNE